MTLIKNQISGAPVAGKNGKILGVVSEADIIGKKGKDVKSDHEQESHQRERRCHPSRKSPAYDDPCDQTPAGDEGRRLVGIVSRADIVSAIAQGEHVAIHTPIYDL